MTWTLTEGLVDAIKAALVAGLPAKLDALDAEYADGIVLADPEAYYVSERELESIHGDAAVAILGDSWAAQPGQYDAGGCINPVHEVRVAVVAFDVDQETLRRRIFRYVRAIFEVIDAEHATGALAAFGPTGSVTADFSPILTGDSRVAADGQLTLGYIKAEQK